MPIRLLTLTLLVPALVLPLGDAARASDPAKRAELSVALVSAPARMATGTALTVWVSVLIGAGDGSSGDPADFTKTVRIGRG